VTPQGAVPDPQGTGGVSPGGGINDGTSEGEDRRSMLTSMLLCISILRLNYVSNVLDNVIFG
jgi:hypothetical protein